MGGILIGPFQAVIRSREMAGKDWNHSWCCDALETMIAISDCRSCSATVCQGCYLLRGGGTQSTTATRGTSN